MRSRPALAYLLAILIVTSGCSQLSPPDRESLPVAPPSTARPQDMTADSTHGHHTLRLEDTPHGIPTREVGEFTVYNLTDEKAESIESGMTGFFEKLPRNESARLNTTAEVARTSCEEGGRIDESLFNASGELNRQGYRVYHAALTFNREFNDGIRPRQIQRVIRTTGEVAKYTTIIGAYNEYYEAACAFRKDDPESVKHFYYAAASLGLELYFIQFQVYYKASFVVTRMASHTRAFRMVQSLFGDDALRILMSETHWLVRNSFHGVNQFIGDEAAAMELTLPADGIDEAAIRERLEAEYGFSLTRTGGLPPFLQGVEGRRLVECGEEAIEQQSKSGIGGVIDSVENSEYIAMFADGTLTKREFDQLPEAIRSSLENCLDD